MRLRSLLVASLFIFAACGGSKTPAPPPDPIEQVPDAPGLRDAIREAQEPDEASFPATEGRTLQEMGDLVGAGPQAALASSVLTEGENRFVFGLIGQDGNAIYGPAAIYIAPTPNDPAEGPFLAPADVLLTEDRYKSKQAATEEDPFAAVYAARPTFSKDGKWAILLTARAGGRLVGAPQQVDVVTKEADKVPDIGEQAPETYTDTLESVGGDKELLDTRDPPSDMHTDLTEVAGKKPVALLFATPALCVSRVCGPVVDIALQMRAKYGEQMEFIHQEVWENNKFQSALRPPLQAFNLPTEPWLFVLDKTGKVTARLEGSFGVGAFEEAVQSGL